MSASKTSFFQGIVSLLKEMSKTFTALSNRIENVEQRMIQTKKIEEQVDTILQQHATLIANLHTVTSLQQDMAKQIVHQHQEVQALYLALGLKKDLSYYSFDITNAEEH